MRRPPHASLVLALALSAGAVGFAASPAAQASGSGSMSGPSVAPAEETPRDRAMSAYNSGVRLIRKADEAMADAARATDPARQDKARNRARDAFGAAQQKFEQATSLAPDMYQAWNYLGYSLRNRGDYDGALAAYDRALAINPQYAEAIEYRGRAYLGLGRTDEAKGAYLALFAANRKLADQLLAAMKDWVTAQRSSASTVTADTLDALGKWIDERGRIAAQTAGLTPDGAGARWR